MLNPIPDYPQKYTKRKRENKHGTNQSYDIASRRQGPPPARDFRLQVIICRSGQEAQGCLQGAYYPFPPNGVSKTETDQFPQVNPDIKGGLIVEIGDRTIDLSVSAKLAKMNKLLQDTL